MYQYSIIQLHSYYLFIIEGGDMDCYLHWNPLETDDARKEKRVIIIISSIYICVERRNY